MELTISERAIVNRIAEKARIAGGVKGGYVMRRRIFEPAAVDGADLEEGIGGLVDKGILQPTESGDRFYLTEEGAELLAPASA